MLPKVTGAPDWAVIHYDFIRRLFPDFRVKSGLELPAKCYKCGDLTDHPQ